MLESGEIANRSLADEDCVIFVSQVETHEAFRALTEPRQRDAMLRRLPLEVFAAKAHATRASLVVDLPGIRARGFSVDDGERNLGILCVAAPAV